MDITVIPVEEELDERTLLARRHILRMRYFTAWEEYTKVHTTMVEYFLPERPYNHVVLSAKVHTTLPWTT